MPESMSADASSNRRNAMHDSELSARRASHARPKRVISLAIVGLSLAVGCANPSIDVSFADAASADRALRLFLHEAAVQGLERQRLVVYQPAVEEVALAASVMRDAQETLDFVEPGAGIPLDLVMRRAVCVAQSGVESGACDGEAATDFVGRERQPDITIRQIECLDVAARATQGAVDASDFEATWGPELGARLFRIRQDGITLWNQWAQIVDPSGFSNLGSYECTSAVSAMSRLEADWFWDYVGTRSRDNDAAAERLLEDLRAAAPLVEEIRVANGDSLEQLRARYAFLLLRRGARFESEVIRNCSLAQSIGQSISDVFSSSYYDDILEGEPLTSADIAEAQAKLASITDCALMTLEGISDPASDALWNDWKLDELALQPGVVADAIDLMAAHGDYSWEQVDEVFGLSCEDDCESALSRAQRGVYQRVQAIQTVTAVVEVVSIGITVASFGGGLLVKLGLGGARLAALSSRVASVASSYALYALSAAEFSSGMARAVRQEWASVGVLAEPTPEGLARHYQENGIMLRQLGAGIVAGATLVARAGAHAVLARFRGNVHKVNVAADGTTSVATAPTAVIDDVASTRLPAWTTEYLGTVRSRIPEVRNTNQILDRLYEIDPARVQRITNAGVDLYEYRHHANPVSVWFQSARKAGDGYEIYRNGSKRYVVLMGREGMTLDQAALYLGKVLDEILPRIQAGI